MKRLVMGACLCTLLCLAATGQGQATPASKVPSDKPAADKPAGPPAPAFAPSEHPRVSVPGTRQLALTSTVGKLEYRIFVGEPKGEAPPQGYPVIYMLDGNANFGTLLEASRRAQRTLGPMVVVGIGYPTDETIDSARRSLDYTSAATAEQLQRLPRRGELKTGGQAEFMRFIQEDLKPVIEKMFPINTGSQTLIGHSFGGLFALHHLFAESGHFQNYVAISPSIWWADMAILTEERAFVKHNGARADLLIAVGGREKEHMLDDAREMARRLNELSGYGLRVSYKEFPDEDHGSVVAAAIGAALRFSQEAGPR